MSITLEALLHHGTEQLMACDVADAGFEASQLLGYCCNIKASLLSLYRTQAVTAEQEEKFQQLLLQRVQGLPLQYVLGEWDFYGRTFFVDRDVLIPRPETEELVDRVLQYVRKNHVATVYDVCGGTGCFGLTVAAECPEINVYIFELYDAPLCCIEKNIKLLGLQNVKLLRCDALKPENISLLPAADVIISNPPYIPTSELPQLQKEVQREPMTALDGGMDGLVFYRALASHWYAYLMHGGRMFLECAEGQPQEILALFAEANKDSDGCGSFRDFYGLERFVIIEKEKKGTD